MEHASLHLLRARKLATLLDSKWSVLGFSFGIDPLLNIIPGITTLIPTALSFYLFYIAVRLAVPVEMLIQMLFNIGIDYLVGSIPVIGIVGDILFKGNMKNLALLEEYVQNSGAVIEGEIIS